LFGCGQTIGYLAVKYQGIHPVYSAYGYMGRIMMTELGEKKNNNPELGKADTADCWYEHIKYYSYGHTTGYETV
jgi:hypothetical protein